MSDKLKDYIDQFHTHGVFIPTKTIRITGPIDEDSYDNLMTNLHALDSMSGEITIKLNSEGGCLTSAKAMYDAISNCKNKVTIVVYGEACSAATIVLQAADVRAMANNSKLMVHSGAESLPENHPRNIDKLYEQHRLDEEWMESLYLKKIKEVKKRFTKVQLRDKLTWDKYLSPKEALELGLIDVIGDSQ